MVVGRHFPGSEAQRAALIERLRLLMIRLAALAERCEDESIRYELRESIEQLVQVIAELNGEAVRNSSQ